MRCSTTSGKNMQYGHSHNNIAVKFTSSDCGIMFFQRHFQYCRTLVIHNKRMRIKVMNIVKQVYPNSFTVQTGNMIFST